MTFIASVIARDGVALIADSLVTSSKRVLDYETFVKLIRSKNIENGDKPIDDIGVKEVNELFNYEPHHTSNYQEKLFKYDDFTGVTTAGNAYINKTNIADIIQDVSQKRNKRLTNPAAKVKYFCNGIKKYIIDHLNEFGSIGITTFLFTSLYKRQNKIYIYKVYVMPTRVEDIEKEGVDLVKYIKVEDYVKVAVEGQNRLSDKILYGDYFTVSTLVPKIVSKLCGDLNIDESNITEEYMQSFFNDENIMPSSIYSDIKMLKLSQLSMQQAVDLAFLLMRIEMEIQRYTEEIPNVGGLIKLAIINKDGFKFISGDEIINPIKN